MSQNLDLWLACQQLFNVTPVLVEDLRNEEGKVRFLATLRDEDGTDVDDLYDETDLLAIGNEDEAGDIRLTAVEDTFMGAPCIVVARAARSYLEENAKALGVTVFLTATDETRHQAVQMVRQASLEGDFDNRWKWRLEAGAREEQARQQLAIRAEEEARARALTPIEPHDTGANLQGRTLFDRWFGRKP